MCTIYANMASPRLVGLPPVSPWIDQPSVVRPASPLSAGLAKIQWQTSGHVYWMEMTEPTVQNMFVCIDRVLARGYRYRLLVGATTHGTRMLLDDPEEPLPVAAMVSMGKCRHVRIWWSMNSPHESMDQLLWSHRTPGKDGTPPSGAVNSGPRENRGQSPNPSIQSDESDSDGHQPESSAAAAKRITRLSTKKWRALHAKN